MDGKASIEPLYATLMNFLLLNKQQLVALGSEFDLTGMQTQTLLMLHWHGSRPMNNLCTIFGCDPSNVTGLIDGLERKGLLRRTEKPGDRRVKILELQAEGAAVCARLLQKLSDKNSYILSRLSEHELAQFIAIMQKLTEGHPSSPHAT